MGQIPKALQNLTEQVQQALTSCQPQFALANAFRQWMRHYFRPLKKAKTEPVKVYGRYFTPPEVIRFLVAVIDPKPGERILDFACGSGGFLGQATRHLLETHNAPPNDIASCLFGYDIDETCVMAARTFLTLMLPGHQAHLNIQKDDGLKLYPENFNGEFDIILNNPPAGDLPEEFSDLGEEYCFAGKGKRWQNLYEVAFLEQAVRMVKDGGRIGIVLPEGIFANAQLKPVREWFLQKVTVHAVVGLPRGIFPFTSSKMYAVVMTKKPPSEHLEVLLAEITRPNMLKQLQQLQCIVKEKVKWDGKAK